MHKRGYLGRQIRQLQIRANGSSLVHVNEIRRLVQQRPFKPLLFQLDNGEKQLVNHPEIIVTEMMIVSVDNKGRLIYIAPETVSTVRYAPINHPQARRNGKRTKSR